MAKVELQQIGSYQVAALLRESPTYTFYLGKQRKRDILIQRLNIPLVTSEEKERFSARAKQLKKLKHRNIVNVLGAEFIGDFGHLVMDYTPGRSLPKSGILPAEAKRYLLPLASALNYTHKNNALHGNLHPGNVLLISRYEIVLTNFSLLPTLDGDAEAIPYMAPEHLAGNPIAASDQYALAVILYELLCGHRPHQGNDRESLLMQQEQSPILPPSDFNTAISPTLEQIILRALSYNPAERFPQVQDFADHYLRETIETAIASDEERPSFRNGRMILPESKPEPEKVEQLSFGFDVPTIMPSPRIIPTNTPLPHTIPVTTRNNQNSVATQEGQTAPAPSDAKLGRSNQPSIAAQEGQTAPAPSDSLAGRWSGPTSRRPVRNEQGLLPNSSSAAISGSQEEIAKSDLPSENTALQETQFAESQSRTAASAHPEGPGEEGDERQKRNIADLSEIVTADLCQGGILSQQLSGYEERPAQVEMAKLVSQAIIRKVPAIIEAATGTGKSLSYLLPAVRSGKVAIVSTANKALQEQLFYKDIPFIQRYVQPFDAALVKGMANYICLEHVEYERMGPQLYLKEREFTRLLKVLDHPPRDFSGDLETIGFQLSHDMRSKVTNDSDSCTWSKCDYFEDCFVRRMRRQAAHAKVIVVNHTLLLLDALNGSVLPERDVIILDEAHHLEEEATRVFTTTVGPKQVKALLAQRLLREYGPAGLQLDVEAAALKAWNRLEEIADPANKACVQLRSPLEEGLHLATRLSELADTFDNRRPLILEEKEEIQYNKLLGRIQSLSANIRHVFSVADPKNFVYYAERIEGSVTRGFVIEASAAPLDVAPFLKEHLFAQCNVICTSATLATTGPSAGRSGEKGANFVYYRHRVGLDRAERDDVLEHILPLTFDYQKNALLYIPRELPEPAFGDSNGADEYMKAIARQMYQLVKLSRGRAFLLFSSRRMLDRAYELMSPHLPYPLLKQGDMTRLELTQRFRQEEGAILFGLKTFWEGVDIAGDALSLVVIDKLPFNPPDDPIHEARVKQMKEDGEDWFGTYVLPQTILRLKQGIGRLLRTREDRGVMAILDTRLHIKGYGRLVIDALPPARRTSSLRDVEQFFLES